MRLIDADALKNVEIPINGYWDESRQCYVHQPPTWMQAFEVINKAPTIDAVPVVHSWWEISEHNNSLIPCVGYKCHNCGSKYARINTEKKEYNYCPWCGARMDGRREDSLYQSLKKGLEEAIAYENGEVELRTEHRKDSDI